MLNEIRTTVVIAFAALVAAAGAGWGASPEDSCEATKNQEAGKYAYCRAKAEAKAIRKGVTPDYSKCNSKLLDKWARAENTAIARGAACIDAVSYSAIQGFLTAQTDAVATALDGGVLPADVETCNGALTTCQGDLTTCGDDVTTCDANLGACSATLAACDGDLTTCSTELNTCNVDLATCTAAPQGKRVRTGQTQCWDSSDVPTPCVGTAQDGEFQDGLVASFTDNGDGTITDTRTGLMWEKLSDDGSIHDKDATFTWYAAFSTKIATLNSTAFAGYGDWRLPNINELQSLVNYGTFAPAVHAPFDTGCAAGCTVLNCSCTEMGYWSSTTYQTFPTGAWGVGFETGNVVNGAKAGPGHVRAVRGGP